MFDRPVSVSYLNLTIKQHLEENHLFKHILVEGEISNLTIYSHKKHVYFKLKDENSEISVTSFNIDFYLKFVKENIKEGDSIKLSSSLNVYVKGGKYTLIAKYFEKKGEGSIMKAFKDNYDYYKSLGYFDESRKMKLSKYVTKIAIVTSLIGDVISDIFTTIKRRNSLIEIDVYNCKVQGNDAANSVVRAFKKTQNKRYDAVIIARGGGSAEDLQAFSEPFLLEEIYKRNNLVISAIGHDTDWSLLDYLSDVRASTPTAAAELVSTPIPFLFEELTNFKHQLNTLAKNIYYENNLILKDLKEDFSELKNVFVNEKLSLIKDFKISLKDLTKTYLINKKNQLDILQQKSTLINPLNILAKGYHLVYKNNLLIKNIKVLKKDEEVTVASVDEKKVVKVV